MNFPIALFSFNRPDHLTRTLDALAQNYGAAAHDVFAFSDGPREPRDAENVRLVRRVLAKWSSTHAFRSFTTIERPKNFGLARSVISGVTDICEKFDRIVVLEDDLITSAHFLAFMRDGLTMYADNPSVASIHGYAFPMAGDLPETYFLAGADCWGWGTWKRSWTRFNEDGSGLLKKILQKKKSYHFDVDGSYPYTRMLRHQAIGRNNSWAIRWRALAYLAGMVSLHPVRSLVANIGFDGSGTHCPTSTAFSTNLSTTPIAVSPQVAVESIQARRALARYFRSIAGPRGRIRCAMADIEEAFSHLITSRNAEGANGHDQTTR